MANELKLSFSLSSSLGSKPGFSGSLNASPANADSVLRTQDATTSAAAIVILPVTTGKWLLIINTDATNFVNIGVDASVATPIAKLVPAATAGGVGGFLLLAMAASTTYYCKADTATCKLITACFS